MLVLSSYYLKLLLIVEKPSFSFSNYLTLGKSVVILHNPSFLAAKNSVSDTRLINVATRVTNLRLSLPLENKKKVSFY